jgi:hypothetical protein
MDASFGHTIPRFRAASATLAGSPEAPNPRIKQANTGVHHGAMALSLHNEAPAVPGGEEAEGGSGTWQQAVECAHGALIEDDTDHSSPLQAAADAGSIGSMVRTAGDPCVTSPPSLICLGHIHHLLRIWELTGKWRGSGSM